MAGDKWPTAYRIHEEARGRHREHGRIPRSISKLENRVSHPGNASSVSVSWCLVVERCGSSIQYIDILQISKVYGALLETKSLSWDRFPENMLFPCPCSIPSSCAPSLSILAFTESSRLAFLPGDGGTTDAGILNARLRFCLISGNRGPLRELEPKSIQIE